MNPKKTTRVQNELMNTSQVCWLEAHQNDFKSRISICFEVFPLPPTTRTCWLRTLTFTCFHSDANIICCCFERTRKIFDNMYFPGASYCREASTCQFIHRLSQFNYLWHNSRHGRDAGWKLSVLFHYLFTFSAASQNPTRSSELLLSQVLVARLSLSSASPRTKPKESRVDENFELRMEVLFSLPPSPSCFIVD